MSAADPLTTTELATLPMLYAGRGLDASRYLASLTEFPSGLVPDEAVARISWTVSERALGVVTGEVGAGKTVAVRAALAGLDQARHKIIYLGNPSVGARGIHHAIVTALGQQPRFHTATLIPQAADALATEHDERGRSPVLILDEAHLLSHTQLEFGELAALDQRIAMRYQMTGMTLEETASYLKHHLALAGCSDPLLSDDAITLIHQTSRGYPRMINNLASQALLAALTQGKAIVDESTMRTAVTEVTTE